MTASALVPLIAFLGFIVLIVLVGRQSWRKRVNQLFIWYASLLAAWSFGSFMVYAKAGILNPFFWNSFLLIFLMTASVAFFHFVRVYLMKPPPRYWLTLGYGLCVAFVVTAALGYAVDYAYWEGGVYHLHLGTAVFLMTPVALGYVGVSIYELVQGYRHTRDPFTRNRIVYPLIGISIATVLVMTNFLPGWPWYPVDQAGNFLNALLLSYAILRYRLIDVSFVLRRGFIYSLLTIFVFAVFICVALLLQGAFKATTGYSFWISAVIMALIIAVVFQPVQHRVQGWVDRLFYKESYDYRHTLMASSQRISAMLNMEELAEWLVDSVKATMQASRVGLFLFDRTTQRYAPRVLVGYESDSVNRIRFGSENPMIKHLAKSNRCLTAEDIDRLPQMRSLWNSEKGQLRQLEAEVLVPLKAGDFLTGLIVIGPKLSEDVYTLDDLEILLTVANQAVVAVENARLYEESQMRADKLKESEEKYRDLINNINDGYIVFRGERIVFANRRCAEALGVSLDQVLGERFLDFVAPESIEQAAQIYEASMRGEAVPEMREFVFVRVDGSRFPVEVSFRDTIYEGKPAVSAIVREISERKRAEEELRRRKDELERRSNQLLALQRINASIQSTLEITEVLQQVAEAVVTNLGWDHTLVFLVDEEASAVRGTALSTSADAGMVEIVEQTLGRPLKEIEIPIVRGYSYVIENAVAGKTTIMHNLFEIGENPITEPPLTKAVCDAVQGLLGARTIVNVPAFAKERTVGTILAFTSKPEVTEVELEPLRVLADQAGVAIENATLYHETEEKAQRLAAMSELSRILSSSLNITDVYQDFAAEIKKVVHFDRASIALVEGELVRFFAVSEEVDTEFGGGTSLPLADSITEWVIQHRATNIESDFDLEMKFAMDKAHRRSGLKSAIRVPLFSKGEVIGTFNLTSSLPNTYGERERQFLEQVAGQIAVGVENTRLFTELREHQEELERAYKELKAAQDFMVQSEKLRALGEMAGGVAHDFNNILSVILGRAQLALEDTKEPAVRKGLQIIERTALDGAKTVRRLQEFARVRVDRDFEAVNLNQMVRTALQMVEPRRIERREMDGVDIDIAAELDKVSMVQGNTSELREALMNIIFNAMDAMPQGGKITIRSEQRDEWVVLSIADTGSGIPEEIRKKIFDPFFTTKGHGGMGLGLSVTFGIITRHGGTIDVESTLGVGTTFTIRLPVSSGSKRKARTNGVVPVVRGVSVLLVDDDRQVSKVLELMLDQLGHRVTGVVSGKEAIAAFEKGDYGLVITDLGMPDMSGRDVARAVKARRPQTPVILITGWGVQLNPEELDEVDGVIAKPFSKGDLSVRIAELLGADTVGVAREEW
ncbi:MAG: GAF domain-containing protein [Chloroflexota bacterium]|nr:GAF domain-containing protein [Chloroflexota bacterium]